MYIHFSMLTSSRVKGVKFGTRRVRSTWTSMADMRLSA